MKMWQFFKNVMLATLMTTLYAIWSTKELHEVSAPRMWSILIIVGIFIFLLLTSIDKYFVNIQRQRKSKERRLANEKISESAKRTESTERAI